MEHVLKSSNFSRLEPDDDDCSLDSEAAERQLNEELANMEFDPDDVVDDDSEAEFLQGYHDNSEFG